MVRFSSFLVAALVASCAPAPRAPAAEPEAAAPLAAVSLTSLQGAWRAEAVDGRPMDAREFENHGPTRVVVEAGRIRAQSQCVPFAWRVSEDAGRLTLAPEDVGAVCQRSRSAWETAFEAAMTGAAAARPRADGTVLLEGPRGTVLLRREPPPRPAAIEGVWRLEYLDGVNAEAFGSEPIVLTIGPDTIRAQAGCAAFLWRYERDFDALRLTRGNPGEMCARGLSDWERRFERVTDAVNRASVDHMGVLRLTGATADLTLRRAETAAR